MEKKNTDMEIKKNLLSEKEELSAINAGCDDLDFNCKNPGNILN